MTVNILKTDNRSTSQSDRAALGIRDLILTGALKSGERVTELALVKKLGVSRTPIRTALQQLAAEGLLSTSQSSGYRVRTFTDRDIYDAIEARGTIEGLAARMAAERGVSPEHLAAMRACLVEIDQLLDVAQPGDQHLSSYAQLNEEFHRLMIEGADSPMISLALERVASLPFASSSAFVKAQDKIPGSLALLRQAQIHHHEIVNAIEDRSSARVEPLVREHARLAHKNLDLVLKHVQTSPDNIFPLSDIIHLMASE